MPNRLLLILGLVKTSLKIRRNWQTPLLRVANENDAIVLPVGLAFAESLKQRPDLLMHQKDKSHPTAAGSYLYGAMLYGLLFQKSPEGMTYLGECENR